MRDKAEAMVMASFAADSLALGVHWIYDARQISSQYGRVERFLKPREGSFHPTKDKGEFTHEDQFRLSEIFDYISQG